MGFYLKASWVVYIVINAVVSRVCNPSSHITASKLSSIHEFAYTHLDDLQNQQPSVSHFFSNFQ
jgi:hypothetical protein